MRYEGAVYRPPSEARSLIIQLTIGCARNTCTFCYMYKDKSFRVRPLEEVVEDLEMAKEHYAQYAPYAIRRVFLADGDALIVKTKDLLYILDKVREYFPSVERITSYGAPKDILSKSVEELTALREAGLTMVYMGIESGDDVILQDVKKGVTSEEMIAAGQRLKAAGIKSSMMLITGLGGPERTRENAIESARVVSAIKPDYVSLLRLTMEPGTPLYEDHKNGKFHLLTKEQVVDEMKLFLENVDSEGTVFRANHASNRIALAGTLNKDNARMIRELEFASDHNMFRPDYHRL